MTPSQHLVDRKKICVLVNVAVIFCAIAMIPGGLLCGCDQITIPFYLPEVSFRAVFTHILLIFSDALLLAELVIGLLLLRYHTFISAWLIRKAGIPRWNRRFFHPLIFVTILAYWMLQQMVNTIVNSGFLLQYPNDDVAFATLLAGTTIFLLLLFAFPLLLIRFAVFITRRIDRFIG